MESSVPPPVNPGALSGPSEFGLPAVNSGTIMPLNQQTSHHSAQFRRASRIARIGDLRSKRGAAVARQYRLRACTQPGNLGGGLWQSEHEHGNDAEPERRRLAQRKACLPKDFARTKG